MLPFQRDIRVVAWRVPALVQLKQGLEGEETATPALYNLRLKMEVATEDVYAESSRRLSSLFIFRNYLCKIIYCCVKATLCKYFTCEKCVTVSNSQGLKLPKSGPASLRVLLNCKSVKKAQKSLKSSVCL